MNFYWLTLFAEIHRGCCSTAIMDLPDSALEEFQSLVLGRAKGTPVRYLTESVEFFGVPLKVQRGVYIPKWETELLVEEALEFLGAPRRSDLSWGQSRRRLVVHEIGAGSGAIAIAIAKHAPNAEISASEISAYALSLAQANAASNGVAENITFGQGDLQSPLAGIPDLVVANLPYIGSDEIPELSAEVLAQPRSSLLSRCSGMGHIKRLMTSLKINPGGRVMLEIGFGQAKAVKSLCSDSPRLSCERIIQDLAGFDRIAVIAAH